MNRRNFLSSMLALGMAPAIVRAESIMRIKPILLPGEDFWFKVRTTTNPTAEDILQIINFPNGEYQLGPELILDGWFIIDNQSHVTANGIPSGQKGRVRLLPRQHLP